MLYESSRYFFYITSVSGLGVELENIVINPGSLS